MKYALKSAVLYITTYCDGKCEQCYAEESGKMKQHVELSAIKRSIDELVDSGVELIKLSGGNPSLHPQILEITRYLHCRGVKTVILSGSHDYASASMIGIAEHIDALEVAIHGIQEYHDTLTTPNCSYAKIIDRLRLWQRVKRPDSQTGIIMNLTPATYNQIFRAVERISWNVNIDYVEVRHITPCGRTREQVNYKFSRNQIAEINRQIRNINAELDIHAKLRAKLRA